jgi:hypothetical protein
MLPCTHAPCPCLARSISPFISPFAICHPSFLAFHGRLIIITDGCTRTCSRLFPFPRSFRPSRPSIILSLHLSVSVVSSSSCCLLLFPSPPTGTRIEPPSPRSAFFSNAGGSISIASHSTSRLHADIETAAHRPPPRTCCASQLLPPFVFRSCPFCYLDPVVVRAAELGQRLCPSFSLGYPSLQQRHLFGATTSFDTGCCLLPSVTGTQTSTPTPQQYPVQTTRNPAGKSAAFSFLL